MANTKNTEACTPNMRAGRLTKARSYLKAAQLITPSVGDHQLQDVYITNCVYAGIAASDVICCAKLGIHSTGPNHRDAVTLLRTVDSASAAHLKTLLDLKAGAGYSHVLSNEDARRKAEIAATAMVGAAILVT